MKTTKKTKAKAVQLEPRVINAKSVIADFVTVMNRSPNVYDIDAGRLWAVMTALRGPDSDDNSLKEKTTARIRYAIGLREDNLGGAIVVSSDGMKYTSADDGQRHFTDHYQQAFRALQGLGFIPES